MSGNSGNRSLELSWEKAVNSTASERERLPDHGLGLIQDFPIKPDASMQAPPGSDIDKTLEMIARILSPEALTDEQTAKAQIAARESLNRELGRLVSRQTRQTTLGLQDAIMSGNASTMQKLLKGLPVDRVEALASEINKNLEKFGGGAAVTTDGRGNLIVHGDGAQALKVFRSGRKPDVMEKGTDADGNTVFRPADYPDENADEALKAIGDAAMHDVLRSPEERALASLLRRLTPEQQTEFFKMIITEKLRQEQERQRNRPLLAEREKVATFLPTVSVG